jgi:hypothetical protein
LLDANSELLAEVGDFIKQSTEFQKWGRCRSKGEWLAVHFKKKWYSSPISFKLQFLHFLSSLVILLYLPDSISKLWSLTLNFVNNCLKILLDANSELLAEVGDFIKQSTEFQKWGRCRSKVWHVKNIILINRIYFVYTI